MSCSCGPDYCNAKRYKIRTETGSFVMELMDQCNEPGTKVIIWPETTSYTQQWIFFDGKIYNSSGNLVLDVEEDNVVVNKPHEGDKNQEWHFQNDGTIVNSLDSAICLEVEGGGGEKGQCVVKADRKHPVPDAQKWEQETIN